MSSVVFCPAEAASEEGADEPLESADRNVLNASEFNRPTPPEGVSTPALLAPDPEEPSSSDRSSFHPVSAEPVKRNGWQSCPAATREVSESQSKLVYGRLVDRMVCVAEGGASGWEAWMIVSVESWPTQKKPSTKRQTLYYQGKKQEI